MDIISEPVERAIGAVASSVGLLWTGWQIVSRISKPEQEPPLQYCWKDESGGLFGCQCKVCRSEFAEIEAERLHENTKRRAEFMSSPEYARDKSRFNRDTELSERPRSVMLF